MKLGIVIYSNDSETVWNAFRLGNFALQQGDRVSVFLLAKGVECGSLDTDKFKVTKQMQTLVKAGGAILASGQRSAQLPAHRRQTIYYQPHTPLTLSPALAYA